MKKYSICFFVLYLLCFGLMLATYPDSESRKDFRDASLSAVEADAAVETVPPASPEYLGKLSGQTIYLYRLENAVFCHSFPLAETNLTEEERDCLEEGIFFFQLEDFYHYLESITS